MYTSFVDENRRTNPEKILSIPLSNSEVWKNEY